MTKIAFIGGGQMAKALAGGFASAGLIRPCDIIAADPSECSRQSFSESLPDALVVEDNAKAVQHADSVFLAVKPQYVEAALDSIRNELGSRLLISIVAGVPLARLAKGAATHRIIRVMPNTPALVGRGASAYAIGCKALPEDGPFVQQLLSAVGYACQVPEGLLDAVTGLSGSGPAFVYQFIEALSDGGVLSGLPRDTATKLAAQTVLGAAQMVLETDEHPGVLKDKVASPGGTTIAGLHALELGGLRATVMTAVQAATSRSKELGQ